MDRINVTVVVVPRERFSFALTSLDSIVQNTDGPFELIYIDGNSPPDLARALQAKAEERKFQLIRTEHYLSQRRPQPGACLRQDQVSGLRR